MVAHADAENGTHDAQVARFDSLLDLYRPNEPVPTREWLIEHARMPDGGLFNVGAYPHMTAPGGPCDALDDPRYREVVNEWATRLGKTVLGQSYMCSRADQLPCPMLFTTSTESIAKRNVQTKFYPMLEKTPRLAHQLLPPNRRNVSRIDLEHCRIFIGYSGSESVLGDLAAKVIHGSEVDKYDKSRSDEADSFQLMVERAKEFRDAKIYIESTPTIKGRSRIDALYETSTQHRYHVPCPHCGSYQILRFGDGADGAGVIWDKKPDGTSDADLAFRTARYRCESCLEDIDNDERPRMMRRGVWAGRGQTVAANGKVSGKLPETRRWGSRLSSLYALSLTWGDIAYAFLDLVRRPGTLQSFVNNYLAEAFELVTGATDTVDLAERCVISDWHMGTVPDEVSFLTAGVDRQGDFWVWVVVGWARGQRSWLIAWGETSSDADLDVRALEGIYPLAGTDIEDGIAVAKSLVDSGYEANEVYQFCDTRIKRGLWCYPYKSFGNLRGAPYRWGQRNPDERRHRKKRRKKELVEANHDFYQVIIQRAIEKLAPGQDGSLALPMEAAEDDDLLSQLVNEARVSQTDSHGYTRPVWEVVDDSCPVDLRDAYRYALIAADIHVRRKWERVLPRVTVNTPAARPVQQRQRRDPWVPRRSGRRGRGGGDVWR